MSDADSCGYHSTSAVPERFTPDDEVLFRDGNTVHSTRHNVNGEPDEYDNYDLTDHYTRKELARANKMSTIVGHGHIVHQRIEKSDAHPGVNFDGWLRGDKSPYEKFRKYFGHLRVSDDLAGLAWYTCLSLYVHY